MLYLCRRMIGEVDAIVMNEVEIKITDALYSILCFA